jgi:hypothetical protein
MMRFILVLVSLTLTQAFVPETSRHSSRTTILQSSQLQQDGLEPAGTGTGTGTVAPIPVPVPVPSRRSFLTTTTTAAATAVAFGLGLGLGSQPEPAEAIGPVKVFMTPTSYTAKICPPDRPIPGEKAMQGMRGLCVTVEADLKEAPPKDLTKVGVYGFVKDATTGNSVLANNPDLSSDAGQFTMVEMVKTTDKKIQFEFIAAVPMERDISGYANGIGPLDFEGLRLVSFPGGEQYGAINPCEMNEFSDECEVWEKTNGAYTKAEYMMKGNDRTKGR